MKKFFIFCVVALAATTFTACEYDDSDLWNKVNGLEQQVADNSADITALSALIDAMNNGKTITSVETTDEGYTLTFSDGSTVTLRNGAKGDKGDKGDKGAVGAAGATGPQGASGVTAVVIGLGTASAIMGVCSIGMGAVCIFIGKKKKLL